MVNTLEFFLKNNLNKKDSDNFKTIVSNKKIKQKINLMLKSYENQSCEIRKEKKII